MVNTVYTIQSVVYGIVEKVKYILVLSVYCLCKSIYTLIHSHIIVTNVSNNVTVFVLVLRKT